MRLKAEAGKEEKGVRRSLQRVRGSTENATEAGWQKQFEEESVGLFQVYEGREKVFEDWRGQVSSIKV